MNSGSPIYSVFSSTKTLWPFRVWRILILVFTLSTFYLYSVLPVKSTTRTCGTILPSSERLEVFTYRTLGYFSVDIFNSPGKFIVSSSVGGEIATFLEQKKLDCSSYITVFLSFVSWLFALYLARFFVALFVVRRRFTTYGVKPSSTSPTIASGTNSHSVSMLPRDIGTVDEELSALNRLTGLRIVKEELAAVVSLERANMQRRAARLPAFKTSRHLVFTGNPGTGKTTVARLLGRIYAAAGALSSGHLVETDRSGMVGQFIGHTAPLTLQRVAEAKGGVLFIDEAYTLYREDHNGSDFGREAIDALLKAMEDSRDDLCVIVAGYTKEMNYFLSSNPGLQSRFSKIIDFPDYDSQELMTIFESLLFDRGLIMSADDLKSVAHVLSTCYESGVTRKGNGRFVRNLVDFSIERQAIRISGTTVGRTELTALVYSDVEGALKKMLG